MLQAANPSFEGRTLTPNLLTGKVSWLRLGEDRYELAWPDAGIVMEARHLHRGRDRDLCGELIVTTTLPDAQTISGTLSASSFNFSSPRTRSERAKYLADRSKHPDLDWAGAIEMLCLKVMAAADTGEPIRSLAEYDEPTDDGVWEIAGLPLLQAHPMILFGDGGSAKSYLALWLAASLARSGITVLYADWEFSPQEHRKRLRLLSGGTLPTNLYYVRCARPLIDEARRLQQAIAQHKVQYVVCDSIGFAVPGRPEDAEHAGAYFRAVRSLGCGSLHLAHVTKASLAEGDPSKPFGSAFWSNGARSTWYIKRSETDTPNEIEVGLYHKKTNTSALLPARGLRLRFLTDRTQVEPFEVADNEELSSKLPVGYRMRRALRRGPLSVAELAAELDTTEDTIRRTAKRMAAVFLKRPNGDLSLKADDPGTF